MGMRPVPIGEAARHSGVKVPTIRYYEQIGLLPTPPRNEGNRRQYDEGDLHRLAFIRHAREGGSRSTPSAPYWPCRTSRTSHALRPTGSLVPGWLRWSSGSTASPPCGQNCTACWQAVPVAGSINAASSRP